ncbi:MAG: 3-deoxy-manno-octulosonate cytidylyltransferase [Thiohalocapsa sp.]|uniref:3-deoxy-manno-octulosonate cytidylyltransferase n=1 Tax=Thiohalocapsa sp. TaxID=2497641 RepID=UPI0025EDBD6C|nr:3-deoxy-manno-octulosonate cytidylyltransferase [Thiohalocapsa sp.]MCG6940069.1 3-deoxy-manno-octulosonate cytidylyltransferase [Thiohalocapsa sp.]
MQNSFRIVIPARHGASRLPGKPLLDIAGKTLIARVWEQAQASAAGEVVVATDDERVLAHCREIGADAVLTAARHQSGTDRIAEVAAVRGWAPESVIVNLQGDEPCMPPSLIDQLADALLRDSALQMATVATPITEAKTLFDPHVVKVVTAADGAALYFSRAPVPWHRDEFLGDRAKLPKGTTFLRHIGLYAYRVGFLERFVAWPPAPLETAESLEQLRVLWHGERISVEIAQAPPGPGVDTEDDVRAVLAWLRAKEGER